MTDTPAEQAKKMGLETSGWGNWVNPRTGETVAKTIGDKLVKVSKSNHPMRREALKKTVAFAIGAHGDQKYGENPYEYHLTKVAKNAQLFGGGQLEIQVAYLHDTIEDTSVSKEQLSQEFGSEIAELVDLLTNRTNKRETFERIRTNPKAVFVKLCDRLANVSEGGKLDMYRKQHPVFKNILYKQGEFEDLWAAIDEKLRGT